MSQVTTPNKHRAYVVFQGAGSLGVAHFGAWQAIREKFDIVGAAGTSSGAIAAALAVAGCDPETAFNSFQQKWSTFFDYKNIWRAFFWTSLPSFLGRKYPGDGQRLETWISNQLTEANPNMDQVTFKNLYEHQRKYLEIITCNFHDSKQPLVKLSSAQQSYLEIARAVHASVALPPLLSPVTIGNQRCIDGGFRNNFPVETLYKKAKNEECCFIGVRLQSSSGDPYQLTPLEQLMTGMKFLTESSLSPEFEEEIAINERSTLINISINSQTFNGFNFDLKPKDLKDLYRQGKETAQHEVINFHKKLITINTRLASNLSSEMRELVKEAQNFLNSDIQCKISYYCQQALDREEFSDLTSHDDGRQELEQEIQLYVASISNSLIRNDHKALSMNSPEMRPTFLLPELYCSILDMINEDIQTRIRLKLKISNLISELQGNLQSYISSRQSDLNKSNQAHD